MQTKHTPRLKLLAGSWGALHPYTLLFGNPMQGGWPNMDKLLRAGAEFNKWLVGELGVEPMAWSGHLNSEIAVPGGHFAAQYNSPHAIELGRWIDGSLSGVYAPVGRVIPKGFGYPWSDFGALKNDAPAVRDFHHRMFLDACKWSDQVIAAKAGTGDVIYWDGPDALDYRRLLTGEDIFLSYKTVKETVEWQRLVQGVGNGLKDAIAAGYLKNGTKLLFEPKEGGDPGALGILLDRVLTLQAIDEVNAIAGCSGDPKAWFQPETAHIRGGGERISSGVKAAREQGKWRANIHLNCSPLGPVSFSALLGREPNGARISEFVPATDPDYNVWPCAIPEWVDDNVEAIFQAVLCSGETGCVAELEYDSKIGRGLTPAKDDAERHANTMHNLRVMCKWTVQTWKEQVARVQAL
jgi:hypothetical protein